MAHWYKIKKGHEIAYFAWFETVPLLVRVLCGYSWKQNEQGYFFRMSWRKFNEIAKLCAEFDY